MHNVHLFEPACPLAGATFDVYLHIDTTNISSV